MKRLAALGLMLCLAVGGEGEAGVIHMVVADLPYPRVWEAAVRAVAGYPVERAADGVIVTGWRERPPAAGEGGFGRVQERVTLRVEPFADRITRVTAEAEARGWRDGQWVTIADTDAIARDVLARLRDAQS
ncbi:MAG TPA: hypothetical protein VGX21_22545 [Methylomirabilota bacterium]|jgi:hypothetical protein|nr:hypothetical protein [Methylomirabilota bacterium]